MWYTKLPLHKNKVMGIQNKRKEKNERLTRMRKQFKKKMCNINSYKLAYD